MIAHTNIFARTPSVDAAILAMPADVRQAMLDTVLAERMGMTVEVYREWKKQRDLEIANLRLVEEQVAAKRKSTIKPNRTFWR